MKKTQTLMTQWPEYTTFVVTNQKNVEEALAELPESTPVELRDMLETLQQSLLLNGALMARLNAHPRLKKIILRHKK